MARSPAEKHFCPLYNRETIWSECYEVQEFREDEMDAKYLREQVDADRANEICEKCLWYIVNANE